MYQRSLIKKNWSIWVNIQPIVQILPSFFIVFILPIERKNAVFLPKIDQKLAKFFKIVEINKNTINAYYISILDHLNHFWGKYSHFPHFWAHFGLYNYIGKCWPSIIYPLTLSVISPEPLVRFRKFWAFWKWFI